MAIAIQTCQCHCNSCGRETEHEETSINSFSETDEDGNVVKRANFAVYCRGCKTAAIREEITKEGSNEIQIIYKPPRLWMKCPDWVKGLKEEDNTIYGLLLEVYLAANDDQFRLLSLGVRAALDHVMTFMVKDIGGFEAKLDEMVNQGHISSKQKEMLAIVIDAGSATAHRGFKPPRDLLEQMVAAMEAIIRQHYLTGPMLETLKVRIPPRPPLQKKPKE